MKIQPDRIIHLGYAKYWRSEDIVGLLPIEEDRGPGRRTEVYVRGRDEPVIAARTEETILEEMARERPGIGDPEELHATLRDLLAALKGLSPVLRRMLRGEGGFDVDAWIDRLELFEEGAGSDDQADLFDGGG